MKRIAYLNAWGNGSTGKIIGSLQKKCFDEGIHTMLLYGRGNAISNELCINTNNKINLFFDVGISRIFDNQGKNSKYSTKKALSLLDEFKPDLIHLHNLHGYWLNYPMLFKYIKENNIPVIWTLHDCWSVTGHCAYFEYLECENRKKNCTHCPGIKEYPKALIDRSKDNYKYKEKIFTSLEKMCIVTPSQWLKEIILNSYLNKYPIKVIHNNIDRNIFKKCDFSQLFEKYNIPKNKKIVLYVAMSTSDPWKGFEILINSINYLPEDYCIVVVGNCDVKSNGRIINIGRTENQNEMAAFYNMADVLANPSLDDNYPTVNLEALACGLPVAAFYTGGIPEQIDDTVGYLSMIKSAESLAKSIIHVCDCGKNFYSQKCINKYNYIANEEKGINHYLDIYNDFFAN